MSKLLKHAYSLLNTPDLRKIKETIKLKENTLLKENILTQEDLNYLKAYSFDRKEYLKRLSSLDRLVNDKLANKHSLGKKR